MDERDLHDLADEPLPGIADSHNHHRPLESIIRRGEQIRRRRAALRSLATTTFAAAVLVVGVVAWPDPPADVSTDEGPAQEYPAGTSNRPSFLGCQGASSLEASSMGPSLPPEETDGLRFLPTWLPDGMAIDPTADVPQADGAIAHTGQSDRRTTWDCRHSDPALVLRASGGDGTVEAGIKVEGPYVGGIVLEGIAGPHYRWAETELRGGPARRASGTTDSGEFLGFTWTEPDGAGWWIEGIGTDEATLRAVAESLRLQGAPPEGTPAAGLADEAVPPGFEVVWQAWGLPAVADPVQVSWSASFANAACYVTFETGAFEAPAGMRDTAGGIGVEVTVRGKPGLVTSYGGGPPTGGIGLVWQESPDVVGSVGCNRGIDPNYDPGIDAATLVRIADSLEPVEVDDPRFG